MNLKSRKLLNCLCSHYILGCLEFCKVTVLINVSPNFKTLLYICYITFSILLLCYIILGIILLYVILYWVLYKLN